MTKFLKTRYFLFAIAFVVLGVSLAVFISSALTTSPVTSPAASATRPEFEVHFISLNKSQLSSSAHSLAPDYQAIGAGGYVWKIDDYYHIFSSGFESKNDAVLVQNNLSTTHNIKSEIVSIKFPALTLSGSFDSDEKKVITRALGSFRATYQSLYDIAISLDTLVYNEISARLEINAIHATIAGIKADFDTLFANAQSDELKKLGDALKRENQILVELCSGKKISNTQTYASLIKYRYIELLASCL